MAPVNWGHHRSRIERRVERKTSVLFYMTPNNLPKKKQIKNALVKTSVQTATRSILIPIFPASSTLPTPAAGIYISLTARLKDSRSVLQMILDDLDDRKAEHHDQKDDKQIDPGQLEHSTPRIYL